MVRWAYFLSREEIVSLHKKHGGKRGNFDPDNPYDFDHARRFIFKYLLPNPVKAWYASLDDEDGIVFFVGLPLPEPREAFTNKYANRCYKMFGRAPQWSTVVPNSLNLHWDVYGSDKKDHRLELVEYLGSDRDGDLYPLAEGDGICDTPSAT
ncbi:unnamed protein product [Rhizoctonia solani]|uniref:Uncharacterized protein n=1 Tax=Rhizoctonia solani TaxID=456999 RepID=A0A8H3I0E0_9AGAM|nr:unnamed protein product [Rhizoctonia solani]CAE7180356.1 unnamed protein product [Rhizoctonia solani]